MQRFWRFLLSFMVALSAASVVGSGSCAGGLMLLLLSSQPTGENKSFGGRIAVFLLDGYIPLSVIAFILVMIIMWRAQKVPKNQSAKFKLLRKSKRLPPQE